MSCNCFDETLDKVRDHIKKQIPDNAEDVSIEWANQVWLLSGGDHSPVTPKVKVEYRAMKRDGTPKRNLTKDEVSILPTHCCYCGRKYVKKEEQE